MADLTGIHTLGVYAKTLRHMCCFFGSLQRFICQNVTWRCASIAVYHLHLPTRHSLGGWIIRMTRPVIKPYPGPLPASYRYITGRLVADGAWRLAFHNDESPWTYRCGEPARWLHWRPKRWKEELYGDLLLRLISYPVIITSSTNEQDSCIVVCKKIGSLLRRRGVNLIFGTSWRLVAYSSSPKRLVRLWTFCKLTNSSGWL